LLSHCILSPSSEINIVSPNTLSNSLHWKSWSDIEWTVNVESEILV
jgi:hypothetical protein